MTLHKSTPSTAASNALHTASSALPHGPIGTGASSGLNTSGTMGGLNTGTAGYYSSPNAAGGATAGGLSHSGMQQTGYSQPGMQQTGSYGQPGLQGGSYGQPGLQQSGSHGQPGLQQGGNYGQPGGLSESGLYTGSQSGSLGYKQSHAGVGGLTGSVPSTGFTESALPYSGTTQHGTKMYGGEGIGYQQQPRSEWSGDSLNTSSLETTGLPGSYSSGGGNVGEAPVLHERIEIAPAVVETHIPKRTEILNTHIERDYEHTNVHHIVKPVHESVVAATIEHQKSLPTRDVEYGRTGPLTELVRPIESFSTTLPAREEFISEKPQIVEHHLRKEIDVVQPVIEREIVHPELVYTTENIREHFHEKPTIVEESGFGRRQTKIAGETGLGGMHRSRRVEE